MKRLLLEGINSAVLLLAKHNKVNPTSENLKTLKKGKDFQELVNIDPTPKKKYLDWLTRIVLIERSSTIEEISPIIRKFFELSDSRIVTGKEAEIQNYKSLEELQELIRSKEARTQTKMISKYAPKEIHPEAELILDNPNFFIVVPKTKEASIFHGKNTKWCVAQPDSDQFFIHVIDFSLRLYMITITNPEFQMELEKKIAKILAKDPELYNQVKANLSKRLNKVCFSTSRINGWNFWDGTNSEIFAQDIYSWYEGEEREQINLSDIYWESLFGGKDFEVILKPWTLQEERKAKRFTIKEYLKTKSPNARIWRLPNMLYLYVVHDSEIGPMLAERGPLAGAIEEFLEIIKQKYPSWLKSTGETASDSDLDEITVEDLDLRSKLYDVLSGARYNNSDLNTFRTMLKFYLKKINDSRPPEEKFLKEKTSSLSETLLRRGYSLRT
jgi:hypothetical protein